jgi:hypothetical protein
VVRGNRVVRGDEYAKATGGPVLSTGTKEVPENPALLVDRVRARYRLVRNPTPAESQGRFCKLSLRMSPEFLREHPEVRTSPPNEGHGFSRAVNSLRA